MGVALGPDVDEKTEIYKNKFRSRNINVSDPPKQLEPGNPPGEARILVVVLVVVVGGCPVQKDGNGALALRARTIWIWKGARCKKMETVRWRPGRAAF